MKDASKTKQILTEELASLKRRIQELEHSEAERKKVEEALRESETRLNALYQESPIPTFTWQNQGDNFLLVDFNRAAIRITDGKVQNYLGKRAEEIYQNRPLILEDMRRCFTEHSVIRRDIVSKNFAPGKSLSVHYAFIPPDLIIVHTEDQTDRNRFEKALRESEDRYRSVVENASDIIFWTDDTGRFTFVNPAALRITGYKEEEIIGKYYPTFIRSDMRDDAIKFFGRQFVKGIQNTYSEYPILTKEGHEVWLGQNTQLIVEDGHVIGFQAVARDITALKQVEEDLRRNQVHAERLAKETAIMAEIGRVISSTPNIEEVYERFAAEALKLIPFDSLIVNVKKPREDTLDVVYASGADIPERRKGDSFPLKGSVSEHILRTKTGLIVRSEDILKKTDRFSTLGVNLQAGLQSMMSAPLISRNEAIGVLVFRAEKQNAYNEQDISLAEKIGMQISGAVANAQLYTGLKKTEQELKEGESRYRELSIIDDLTQLYNSRYFYHQFKMEIDRVDRYGQPLTLLLLDLDDFKQFNDNYGHIEGDQVLMRFGQVVKRCLRQTDSAYRYGGEEFTILMPMTTSKNGAVTAERIRAELEEEIFSPVSGKDVYITVSIGLAQYKSQEDMKAFVNRVDQLMYQAKKNGKDRVCSES